MTGMVEDIRDYQLVCGLLAADPIRIGQVVAPANDTVLKSLRKLLATIGIANYPAFEYLPSPLDLDAIVLDKSAVQYASSDATGMQNAPLEVISKHFLGIMLPKVFKVGGKSIERVVIKMAETHVMQVEVSLPQVKIKPDMFARRLQKDRSTKGSVYFAQKVIFCKSFSIDSKAASSLGINLTIPKTPVDVGLQSQASTSGDITFTAEHPFAVAFRPAKFDVVQADNAAYATIANYNIKLGVTKMGEMGKMDEMDLSPSQEMLLGSLVDARRAGQPVVLEFLQSDGFAQTCRAELVLIDDMPVFLADLPMAAVFVQEQLDPLAIFVQTSKGLSRLYPDGNMTYVMFDGQQLCLPYKAGGIQTFQGVDYYVLRKDTGASQRVEAAAS